MDFKKLLDKFTSIEGTQKQNLNESHVGFAAVEKAAKKGGASNPAAVAASVGRKKYGKEKFQKMAAAGKRKANEDLDEAAVGIPHKVRVSYDDPSGSGRASATVTLKAPSKEHARRYAKSDLEKKGKKNVMIHAVTPSKVSESFGVDLWEAGEEKFKPWFDDELHSWHVVDENGDVVFDAPSEEDAVTQAQSLNARGRVDDEDFDDSEEPHGYRQQYNRDTEDSELTHSIDRALSRGMGESVSEGLQKGQKVKIVSDIAPNIAKQGGAKAGTTGTVTDISPSGTAKVYVGGDKYVYTSPSNLTKLDAYDREMSESKLNEKSAPGQENWIKANKKHFIDQYGKKKGLEVLYATAWKRSKKNESVNEGVSFDREFHPEEVEELKAVAHGLKDISDLANPLKHRLFNHYEHEMPYGVAKARTGDPFNWIADRLEHEFPLDESAPFGEEDEHMIPDMEEDAVLSVQTDSDSDLLDVLRHLSGLETQGPVAMEPTDIPSVHMGGDVSVSEPIYGDEAELSLTPGGGPQVGQPTGDEMEFSIGEAVRRAGRDHEDGKDGHYDNEPDEATLGVDSIVNTGTDLNRKKNQWRKEYPGDNSMAVDRIEENLWKKYDKFLKESQLRENREALQHAIESGETPEIMNAKFAAGVPAWGDLEEIGFARKLVRHVRNITYECWQYIGPGSISVDGKVMQKGDKTEPIEVDYE